MAGLLTREVQACEETAEESGEAEQESMTKPSHSPMRFMPLASAGLWKHNARL
jgi:hypothetical protein